MIESIVVLFKSAGEVAVEDEFKRIDKTHRLTVYFGAQTLSWYEVNSVEGDLDLYLDTFNDFPALIIYFDVRSLIVHAAPHSLIEMLTPLLTRFEGDTQDGWSSHFWTLEEIVQGKLVEGHLYFDRDGWFHERFYPDGKLRGTV